ncbi:MAG: DUF4434 domain-containing protein [Candidatus Obscuribacterales bacterium]|nr:DUF4434 domain-containing protein [Candidatus Obscuribacterales bacterium]
MQNGQNPREWSSDQQKNLPGLDKLTEKCFKDLGQNTFVIQNLRYSATNNKAEAFTYLHPVTEGRNLVEEILTFSNSASMKDDKGKRKLSIFLGLDFQQQLVDHIGSMSDNEISTKLIGQIDDDVKLADNIATRFGKNKFDGWYLPIEIPNFKSWKNNKTIISAFNLYLQKVSAECSRLKPDAPIAVSPYFNIEQLNAADTAELVKEITANTKVNTLMVQDSVTFGQGGSRSDRLKAVPEYFAMIKKANPHMNLMAIVEVGSAATIEGVGEQLCAQRNTGAVKRLAFDIHHNMNPLMPDGTTSGGNNLANTPFSQREGLYKAYLSAVKNNKLKCSVAQAAAPQSHPTGRLRNRNNH